MVEANAIGDVDHVGDNPNDVDNGHDNEHDHGHYYNGTGCGNNRDYSDDNDTDIYCNKDYDTDNDYDKNTIMIMAMNIIMLTTS